MMMQFDPYILLSEIKHTYANVMRKTLIPSRLSSYLPPDSPYTTPTLTVDTWTKVLIPTRPKYLRDFSLDLPNTRWYLNSAGATNRQFTLTMTTSLTSSVNNTVVSLAMSKNGTLEPGVQIDRKIGTGADVGAISMAGSFDLDHEDYIEVYVRSSLGGTLTFSNVAINILEVN